MKGVPGGHPAADTQPVHMLTVGDLRLYPLGFGHREVDDVLEPAHEDHPAEVRVLVRGGTAAVVAAGRPNTFNAALVSLQHATTT